MTTPAREGTGSVKYADLIRLAERVYLDVLSPRPQMEALEVGACVRRLILAVEEAERDRLLAQNGVQDRPEGRG